MTTMRREPRAPVPWRLLLCGLLLLTSCRIEPLTADPGVELPVPKGYRFSGLNDTTVRGIKAPLRRQLDATVPAELNDVLAFYRAELHKRGWQEKPDGAVVEADRVQITFASPTGPAVLKLGRKDDSTRINLVQRNQDAAAEANVMPKSGQAKLLFANIGEKEAVLAINEQTVSEGANDKVVSLDLPPGKYSYELRVPGHPAQANILTVAAGDAWGLTVGRDGDAWSPLQLY
ncbi:hypothetical protein JQ596_05745 [Bradyrhizobium manausense]|uniref:hypothetical protein n=1 Tax=Bradyrhizobium TaxID=374 RepID=UPI001BA85360|nr:MULTISPECIES: hypothetical protein [Bradyrhizobium]MBR0825029.1 hypothetical protein [Bradyrhizobium manausense]UVO29210.1 hypothetical protein KUF59_00030 [Bradyrhizobium arachidis]